MKRCPECQFLYENESTTCDMDGTPLRYTVKLPTVPGLAQSIWDKSTITLLCAVVLVTVLVILYRATPRAYTSTSVGQMTPVKNEMPAASQDPPSANSAASPESSAPQPAADDSDSSTDSRGSFEAPANTAGTKASKSKRGLPSTDEKQPMPAIHVQAAANSPVVNASSTTPSTTQSMPVETSVSQTAQKPASAISTANHPLPPAAPAIKANTSNQKKDSGFKSMLKKAGKILKKPFGEN